jgi:hypothetical protein
MRDGKIQLPSRQRLSSAAREALYDRCRGDAEFPTCNICDRLILIGDAWDESHDPEGPARCFGGTETGVAHRDCNRRHGAEVVRPLDAKATRVRQRHIGAFQTRHKLPGGRTGESARSTAASFRGGFSLNLFPGPKTDKAAGDLRGPVFNAMPRGRSYYVYAALLFPDFAGEAPKPQTPA